MASTTPFYSLCLPHSVPVSCDARFAQPQLSLAFPAKPISLKAFKSLPLKKRDAFANGFPRIQRNSNFSVRCEASSGTKLQRVFTKMAWQALDSAPEMAKENKHQIVETEHLMKALLEQKNGLARRIFSKVGIDNTPLLEATEKYIQSQPKVLGELGDPKSGSDLNALVLRAWDYKQQYWDSFVSVEHLVLGFSQDQRFGKQLFRDFQISEEALKSAIESIRGWQSVFDRDPEGKYEALGKYGKDLTAMVKVGKLDLVGGRDDQIRICIQILSRRIKNNPVLIGEPGVGMTGISAGLALRIMLGDVPQALRNVRLMSLDVGALITGAKDQGEFEDRLKAFLKEATESDGQTIFFIDEIHTVFGAGATNGAVDAGNLLKPMLARGELRWIGTTTFDEYRKYIEKDPALKGRFQEVYVDETTSSFLRRLLEIREPDPGLQKFHAAILSKCNWWSERVFADEDNN